MTCLLISVFYLNRVKIRRKKNKIKQLPGKKPPNPIVNESELLENIFRHQFNWMERQVQKQQSQNSSVLQVMMQSSSLTQLSPPSQWSTAAGVTAGIHLQQGKGFNGLSVCVHSSSSCGLCCPDELGALLPALTSTELAEVCLPYLPASLYICCLPTIPGLSFLLPAQTCFKRLAAFHTTSDGSVTAEGGT